MASASISKAQVVTTRRHMTVYKAKYKGVDCYVKQPKTALGRKELKQEELRYNELAKLQGTLIPQLLYYGKVTMKPSSEHAAKFNSNKKYCLITKALPQGFIEFDADKHEQHRHLLIAAVQKLHKCGYVHGDIRQPNILVKSTGSKAEVRLIDFELTQKLEDEEVARAEIASIAEQ